MQGLLASAKCLGDRTQNLDMHRVGSRLYNENVQNEGGGDPAGRAPTQVWHRHPRALNEHDGPITVVQ